MRILHVWDSEYPWDVRVEKVSRSLTEAGHEVHLVARNESHRACAEHLEEGTVHRMKPFSSLPSALDSALQFPAFFNPRWIRLVARTAEEQRCEVIVVRDLPLALTCAYVGRRKGLPVVLDMAENYPAMIRAVWDHGKARPLDYLVRLPSIVRTVERASLTLMDHVFVVVEESRDRLLRLGVPAERITVVRNTPPLRRLLEMKSVTNSRRENGRGSLRLCYLGLMEAPRGIDVALDAVRELDRRGVDCHLDLIGTGRDLALFMRRARRLGLSDGRVTFHGFLPHPEALKLIATADVGLMPHFVDEAMHTTLPNKLFDYMAASLAVLSSDATPAVRIIRETGCGAVYEGTNPDALADAVETFVDTPRRRAAAEAGRAAVFDRYHWERDGSRLVDALERVLRTRRSALTGRPVP